ncbi:ABC transporter substrate-binding protein [Candidatus Poriferisocius sp.]|uniref:ABC transporter substrate-binding protein n=1 Tax=Candidatus Poriferisocius sp. TaxID=3101276 RepID=UPI003B01C396
MFQWKAMFKWTRLAIAVMMLLALVAASCGSDDDDAVVSDGDTADGPAIEEQEATEAEEADPAEEDSAEEADPAEEEPAEEEPAEEEPAEEEPAEEEPEAPVPSGEPIRVANIFSQTGPLDLHFTPAGFDAWVADVNSRGGIHGRPVEVMSCNDELDPALNEECARSIVGDDTIIAVAGGLAPLETWIPILTEGGVGAITSIPTTLGEFSAPNFLAIGGGAIGGYANLLADAVASGNQRIAFIRTDLATGDQAAGIFTIFQAQIPGWEFIDVPVNEQAADFLPAVQNALSQDPDYIATGLQGAAAARVALDAQSLGFDGTVSLIGGGFDPALLEVDGFVLTADFPDPSGSSAVIEAYRANLANPDDIGDASLGGYFAGLTLEEILVALGPDNLTREAVLARIQDPTPLTVPELGDLETGFFPLAPRLARSDSWIVTVQDGALVYGSHVDALNAAG